MVEPLAERWRCRWEQLREWMGLGVIFIPIGERLLARYLEEGRHYHDARHVLTCIQALDDHARGNEDAIELALWFHDAVYDVHAPSGQNQRASADYFYREFGELAGHVVDSEDVRRLILATQHVGEPDDGDARLICDIDLEILGASPARYDLYAAGIRKEYGHVDEQTYRLGRRSVVESFLTRRSIYWTRPFRKLLEEQARENLMRELIRL